MVVCRQTWCWRMSLQSCILICRQQKEELHTGHSLSIYEILKLAPTVSCFFQQGPTYSNKATPPNSATPCGPSTQPWVYGGHAYSNNLPIKQKYMSGKIWDLLTIIKMWYSCRMRTLSMSFVSLRSSQQQENFVIRQWWCDLVMKSSVCVLCPDIFLHVHTARICAADHSITALHRLIRMQGRTVNFNGGVYGHFTDMIPS